ncbi:glycoside hydrolase family 11 protein [Carboxylicivirga linearis]|uniref:Endo-1,4-beta-xylanase n=1 Tax=Carboxylicivirga linearis TaxID=1628157 RepID=A0ABS5JZD8_9BACT|nr:glycoside hydrolase family 11 protein [Carboxylicivirga linearis]MBS2099686.1 glycoside hydrolase family 11 protein [Carboxylicivirga linearis]
MKQILSLTMVLILALYSCEEKLVEDMKPKLELQLKTYESGTNNDYFWSLWKSDGLNGSVNYTNGEGGNYSVSWDMYDGNFTCGKGWSSGSRNRVVGYNCGSFSLNGGGGSMAYYGWTRNPLIEYYVNEKWGAHRPADGASLGTVYSDGGTYNIYTSWRSNAPSIDGTQSFRQVYSTRTLQNSSGENHTITFANHANAWADAGYGLGADISPSAILLTEAWGSSNGYCNVTVWDGGSSSNTDPIAGVKRLVNRGSGLSIDGLGRTANGEEAAQYNSNSTNAHWNIVSAGSGFYYIVNQGTNMKLDGYGRTTNGDAVAQYNNSTTHVNAQWKIISAGSGYYYIQNRGTNMKIDGYGRTSDGSALAQYDSSTTHYNAQWQLVD